MAKEEGKQEVPPASDTVVPTVFTAKVTLPPGGSATFNVQADLDVVLQGFAAQATGPALVRVQVRPGNPCDSGAPTIRIPGGSFSEYLEQELPGHLADLAEEHPTEWARTNQQLLQGAEAGDDETLFKLLSRDPRHLGSEVTLRRVLTWRTQIQDYQQRYHIKASQFWVPAEEAAQAKRQMETARHNLLRLGQCQLALYDQRGKRPLPPADQVRGIYYGLLCLLQGLRVVNRDWDTREIRPAPREQMLADLLAGLRTLSGDSPFLSYVVFAAHLLTDPEVLVQAELAGHDLHTLVNGKDVPPSDTARAIAAAAFDISDDTVERLRAQHTPILLSSSPEELCFLVGSPAFALLEFPEVQALRTRLAC